MLERKLTSPLDMQKWRISSAYSDIVGFIESVSKAVERTPVSSKLTFSQNINNVVALLEELYAKIADFPPVDQPQRFGNKAFTLWHEWLSPSAFDLCKKYFGQTAQQSGDGLSVSIDEGIGEAAEYLVISFGNPTRIDYGTGHELNFLAFIISLFKLGFLNPHTSDGPATIKSDLAGVGLSVMPVYLKLVRKLQAGYRMEPAGSHGVYSLDDYQFVPFIWGSSQLFDHDTYRTTAIGNSFVSEQEKNSNLFFSCLDYIRQVKTGPFEEHSSTLYSLTNVPHWQKVNSGLMKMYKGEVLDKFPVVQHFLFGKLLSFNAGKPSTG